MARLKRKTKTDEEDFDIDVDVDVTEATATKTKTKNEKRTKKEKGDTSEGILNILDDMSDSDLKVVKRSKPNSSKDSSITVDDKKKKTTKERGSSRKKDKATTSQSSIINHFTTTKHVKHVDVQPVGADESPIDIESPKSNDENHDVNKIPSPTTTTDGKPVVKLHPFFQCEQDLSRKKERISKREENQKLLEQKLHTGPVAEMFLSKKERDIEYVEKLQNDFRNGVIKSSEDHALINAGKPVHPFFQQQRIAAQQSAVTAAANSKQPIDIDDLRLYYLCDYPGHDSAHIGWTPSVTSLISPTQRLERLSLSSSNIEYNGLWLEPNSLIGSFTSMLEAYAPPSSQESIIPSSCEATTTTPQPIVVDVDVPQVVDVVDVDVEAKPASQKLVPINDVLNNNNLITLFALLSGHGITFTFTLEQLIESFYTFKEALGTDGSSSSALWTDHYFPRVRTLGVDNKEQHQMLTDWFGCWREKDQLRYSTSSAGKRKKKGQGAGGELSSTIVICGPYGCGKTSIIYSLCKQHSYQILEVNPSSRRSGKYIMDMFGEATQSKSLNGFKSISTATDMSSANGSANMVLFEEVDTLFEDDRGFFNALSNLTNISKIPIVITCNELTPSIRSLIANNDLCLLQFDKQSPLAVILQLYFTLFVEGRLSPGHLTHEQFGHLLRFVELNQCDVRKCMYNLQFISLRPFNNINLYQVDHLLQRYQGANNLLVGRIPPPPAPSSSQQTDPTLSSSPSNNHSTINDRLALNRAADSQDVDIYFCNYITYSCNLATSQPDTLESLWKVSNDLSFNDIITAGQPNEQITLVADELNEIDDNSPTFIQHPLSLHDMNGATVPTSLRTLQQTQQQLDIASIIALYSLSINLFDRQQQDTKIDNAPFILDIEPNNKYRIPNDFHQQPSCFAELIDQLVMDSRSVLTSRQLTTEYQPALRTICEAEFKRKQANPKRGNRFTHYLDIDDHESELILASGFFT
ncbi:hypothetical protein SAMD00019534_092450 [Acytostelium subglobosum LB1]|uniref:hypothetical protein n=1 Tax=Acytostelium subglobosum LB1 TaxID=1410327 RepID=UPI000644F259|nr:hypothetical protein SAMD00019534_092450 [Acytostelium subglobosum LB1]GAM26070.1 hypothetical protein SAMD00019534_092450 [Acytostelium subglobosum LB1]|eukprot:XP_012751113.1 hypothetical protein SAMD00019534_092450 [Acytostelium subglobosum LB1]